MIVAGLAIWAVATVLSVASQKPGVPGKFTPTINQMVADAQGETAGQPNGWPLVLQAAEMYTRVSKPYAEKSLPEGVPASFEPPLSPEMITDPEANDVIRREVVAMIAEYEREGLFEKLGEVAASQRFVRELPGGKLIEAMIPEVGAMRGMARLCKARMFLAAEAKDGTAFVRAARQAFALGNAASKQATMIDRLVGTAIDSMTCMTISDAIRDQGLDEATCRSLFELLDGRRGFDAASGLKLEHLSIKDTVEWTHSDDGNGDGRMMPSQASSLGVVSDPLPTGLQDLIGLTAPSKRQTLNAFEDLFRTASEQAAKGLRERDSTDSLEMLDKYTARYKIVHILMPSVGRFITLSDQHDLTLAGTRALLAVELHKHATGSYPARLEDLEPSMRATVTTAPWGAEMRYRLFAPGEDPEQRPYLLYWIGLDGTDDGGTTDPLEGSHGAWRPKKKGVDFVFNEPKAKPKAERESSEEAGK
jgi:hypothetical protein